ncbi:MAG: hypothetical protein WEA04_02405 [Candidatus Andersenbacteria bacterium]
MKLWSEIWYSWLRRRTYTALCGHETQLVGSMAAWGETLDNVRLNFNNERKIPYCHNCLATMAIACAWCKKAIFPGDPVTLYIPRDNNYQLPEGSRVYSHDPLQVVGCLRWECAESGIDRAGFWYPPGEVFRVLSPLELVLKTKDVVVINDLADMKEATDIA